jgi:hypothetical protein
MRFVIAPVVTMLCRTSRPAVSSYGGPARRRVASTSYIQFSNPWRAKFSASTRSIIRESLDTRATIWSGELSTSGRTSCHWPTTRSTASGPRAVLPVDSPELTRPRVADRIDVH